MSDWAFTACVLGLLASPRSMGWGDSFRVTDAYRIGGKWFHKEGLVERELCAHYITHWMPIPNAPAALDAVRKEKK